MQSDAEAIRLVLARNLKALMKEREMGILKLSHASGVARSTIKDIRARKVGAGVDTLEALAGALGVTEARLLDRGPGSSDIAAGKGNLDVKSRAR